ncbi:MarR family winged helix-turn-helix transcriptional regulator [Desulfosporosinus meridiei]|uniref:Transcriptional regulator n=1 Tax=Desulfosporosinus meridiei (strain ATCC BAA-275 / DSM 13257 / KCTC 12902 / NCIMB 13706 / S10) TaxID=768704 RepID=J7IPJ6_DESMD|nr:MarR family transcriptional regulator [Desulfosporosinus meridiei]AFQ43762.1 transcriptional regulator [Desulfosporosinus meridiei DSM 13257]
MEMTECINFLLTQAQQKVFKCLKSELEPFNVTPVQYGVLQCLWDKGSQTPKQIGSVLGLDSSTITGILDRLENKALIMRNTCKGDRRTINVDFTEEGLKLRDPIGKIIEEVNKEVLKQFSLEEQNQLKKFLERI